MLGGAGAVAFLTQHGWWGSIDEVVSVSGGSTANAALLVGGAQDAEKSYSSLRQFFDRATADRGQPWKQSQRVYALGVMALTVGALLYLVLGATRVIPIFGFLREPWGGLLVGLLAPSLASGAIRRAAAEYLRAYLGALTNGAQIGLADFADTGRQHVICATGLATGHPYYLWSGGHYFYAGGDLSAAAVPHTNAELWGVPAQAGHSVADAVFASSSLPTLARVETAIPPRVDGNRPEELLIDGGVSGIFGLQVSSGLRHQGYGGRRSDTTDGHVIVIDSGRHVNRTGRVGRWLLRLSISSLLARWLKVSLEANYRRDIAELDDAHLVRIAEGFDEIPNDAQNVVSKYNELRRRTSEMGLANYNADRALNAFVTGWVGCSLTLIPASTEATIDAGLSDLGARMGLGEVFALHWRSVS